MIIELTDQDFDYIYKGICNLLYEKLMKEKLEDDKELDELVELRNKLGEIINANN
jgi:hypothetical protein